MKGITVRSREEAQAICLKYVSFIPEKWYEALEDIMLGITDTLFIPQAEMDLWEQKLTEYRAFNEKLNRTARRNNLGLSLEKEGRVDEALLIYEENIAEGYPATHSFDRLMILYRKRKEYEIELRVIDRALEVFGPEERWEKRKEKVQGLLNTR